MTKQDHLNKANEFEAAARDFLVFDYAKEDKVPVSNESAARHEAMRTSGYNAMMKMAAKHRAMADSM